MVYGGGNGPCRSIEVTQNEITVLLSHSPLYPSPYCDSSRINHRSKPNNHHERIAGLSQSRLRDPFVMQQRRIDIHEWHACETSNECHKFVQIASAQNSNEAAQNRDTSTKGILLPFGSRRALPRGSFAKKRRFNDAEGGKELHRCADEHSHGIEELHGIDELTVLWVV